MRVHAIVTSLLLLSAAACDARTITGCCSIGGDTGLRVVNAYTTPVDVLIDGSVVASAVAAGAIATVTPTLGSHTVTLRPAGSALAGSAQSITTAAGALNTVAAVRQSDGSVASATLD